MSANKIQMLCDASYGGFSASLIPKDLPGILNSWENLPTRAGSGSDINTHSPFHNSKMAVSLHSDVTTAAALLANPEMIARWRPGSGVVKVASGIFLGEYHHLDDSITFVQYNILKGDLNALRVTGAKNNVRVAIPELNKNKKQNLLPIFLVILAAMRDQYDHVDNDIEVLSAAIYTGDPVILAGDVVQNALFRLSDVVYFGLKDEKVPLKLSQNGTISKIPDDEIFGVSYPRDQVICGEPVTLLEKGRHSKKNGACAFTVGYMKNLPHIKDYVEKRNNWTPEQRQFIPAISDDMVVPPEVIEFITYITASADSKKPMVNFLWRGTSGFGKSTGAEIMAAVLQKPLLRFTCSSTTEIQDFLSTMMPNTGSGSDRRDVAMKLSVTEITMDPEGSYEQLTGEYVPGISHDEVFEKVKQVLSESSEGGYVMRESTYIQALQHGYIIEVQEMSRIRDAGVLPGLNEYDRPGALIPRVDGTFVRRHPDAIYFCTDNVGYNSCNYIDPAVMRRFHAVIDSDKLDKNRALDRIISNTSISDRALLSSMYDVWETCLNYCEENDMLSAGGSMTIEELERWVQTVHIVGVSPENLKRQCQNCIVSKATTDYSEQKNIMAAVILPALAKAGLT